MPRRRELSLWPLALIPGVGGLLILGLLVLGSHFVDAVGWADSEREMLDSLEHDARAVTPPGMHEIALHRHHCGDIGDSFPTTVLRDLALDARADRTKSRDAADLVPPPWLAPGPVRPEVLARARRAILVCRDGRQVGGHGHAPSRDHGLERFLRTRLADRQSHLA